MNPNTIVYPAPWPLRKCKDRLQMAGDKTVKCFGERYHTIDTLGIHAGYFEDKVIRWKTEYVT